MKNNLVPVIQRLHDPESRLLTGALEELRAGKVVILDLSLLSGTDARLIASWILTRIFQNNQLAYTRGRSGGTGPRTLPVLAVLEEAQFYLGEDRLREDSPFVRWFKEGRKFQLGSVLVTQQPGAIGTGLISQCDNFFVFHLLSRDDLNALASANLHYDGDIATAIGSEPIPGNCFLWSSRGLAFVTCARILRFADMAGPPLEEVAPATDISHEPEVRLPITGHLGESTPERQERLRRAFVEAVTTSTAVHLFPVQSIDPPVDIPLEEFVAVSETHVARAIAEILRPTEGRTSKANPFGTKAAEKEACQRLCHALGGTPLVSSPFRFTSPGKKEVFLLLRATALDLSRNRSRRSPLDLVLMENS